MESYANKDHNPFGGPHSEHTLPNPHLNSAFNLEEEKEMNRFATC